VKNPLFENFGLKISAVLIAVFLWFFVTSRGQSEISLEAPIEFKDMPADLGISSSSAKTVTLTIRGQERFMKRLNASDIRVFVDLTRARHGESIFNIGENDVKLPFAMTVVSISPSSVKVRLEEMISRTVPVQPHLLGTPEKGLVASVSVEPKSVVIRGLRSEVRKIDAVRTEAFNISDVRETETEELELDMSGMNIKSDVSKVRVTITLAEKKR
jgi:YbbR domain-containing protein